MASIVLDTLLYVDGGSRRNGDESQEGYGSFLVDGEQTPHRLEFGSCTNNEAEYRALIAALEYCAAKGIRVPTVRMDSALVVNQVKGRWKCKMRHLRPLLDLVHVLVAQFAEFRLEWRDHDEIFTFLGH